MDPSDPAGEATTEFCDEVSECHFRAKMAGSCGQEWAQSVSLGSGKRTAGGQRWRWADIVSKDLPTR